MKFAGKNVKAKFIAECELSVKRVVTFRVVFYYNQWPVNFILLNCILVFLSDTKNTYFGNYFLKCNIVQRI